MLLKAGCAIQLRARLSPVDALNDCSGFLKEREGEALRVVMSVELLYKSEY